MSLIDIAFPYRAKRTFGAASFALVFLTIVLEVESLTLVALAIVVRRLDLFIELQDVILPSACFISLATTTAFWWRARAWSRQRVEMLNVWAGGATAGRKTTPKP